MRRAAALLAALGLALFPAAALGQSNPFSPLAPAQPPQTEAPKPKTTPTGTTDDGLDNWQKILIFAAGGVLLGGIAWVIVADARKRAPVKDRFAADGPDAPDPHRERAKQRARKKAKQARAQRKRNR